MIHGKQAGFAMPVVIFMIVIMSTVAYAALMQTNNLLNLSYKQAYIQMSRVAAKASINYAKEQFDNDANYGAVKTDCNANSVTSDSVDTAGTCETTLISNSRYRLTYRVEVTGTSADGLEKSIKGTGSVYIPELSTTAKYVFDIRTEVVRTYATQKQPSDFGNLVLWLDANKPNSLIKNISSTTNVSSVTTFGTVAATTRDTIEELETNGTQTATSWQSTDLEMSYCDSTEFTSPSNTCTSSSTRKQYIGMIFPAITVPKDSTIVSANLVVRDIGNVNGSVTHRWYGLYDAVGDPSMTPFTSTGTNQVKNRITNTSLRTGAYVDNTSNNPPNNSTRTIDVRTIVQEIVNNSGWTSGSNLTLAAQHSSGNGVRKIAKNGISLTIVYSTSGTAQSGNGDTVNKWLDARGNGVEAISTHGNPPTKIDNQLNGKPIVRFNAGDMLASLATAQTGDEYTVIGVLQQNWGSTSNARFVTTTSASQSGDTTSGGGFQALKRNASTTGFATSFNGASNSTTFVCTTGYDCGASNPIVVSAYYKKGTGTAYTAYFRANGNQRASSTFSSSASFSFDQIWIGGSRISGSGTGTGGNYLSGDFAEIAVYSDRLECSQLSGIEDYLRVKWGIAGSQWTNDCPADNVPVL